MLARCRCRPFLQSLLGKLLSCHQELVSSSKPKRKPSHKLGFTNLSREYRPRSLKAHPPPPQPPSPTQGGQTRPGFAKVLGCDQDYSTLLSKGLPTHPPPTIALKSEITSRVKSFHIINPKKQAQWSDRPGDAGSRLAH